MPAVSPYYMIYVDSLFDDTARYGNCLLDQKKMPKDVLAPWSLWETHTSNLFAESANSNILEEGGKCFPATKYTENKGIKLPELKSEDVRLMACMS